MQQSFLQTPEWLAFQQSIGRKGWRLESGFVTTTVLRQDVRLGHNFLYIPYGPLLDLNHVEGGLQNEIRQFAAFLRGLARDEKSMFVKIEPMNDAVIELLIRSGVRLKKSNRSIQPTRTVVADLTQSDDELLNKLHHKHRYNIGLAERKGVTIAESHDSGLFWRMLQQTAEHDAFRTHNKNYYEQLLEYFADPAGAIRTKLYCAFDGSTPLAGVIMVEYGTIVTYLHGASDRQYRSLMAPHLLHWTLMKQYKQQGFTGYDFWGIDSVKWPGVTRFKLGFGARHIEYPGSFDLVIRPFWRWLYQHLPR